MGFEQHPLPWSCSWEAAAFDASVQAAGTSSWSGLFVDALARLMASVGPGELQACSCSWGWLGTVSAALGQAVGLEPTAVPHKQALGRDACAPWLLPSTDITESQNGLAWKGPQTSISKSQSRAGIHPLDQFAQGPIQPGQIQDWEAVTGQDRVSMGWVFQSTALTPCVTGKLPLPTLQLLLFPGHFSPPAARKAGPNPSV